MMRLVRGALVGLLLLSCAASAVPTRFTLVGNYDGTLGTAYPAGDKPDAGNVAPIWTATPIVSCVEGVVSSVDLNPDYVSDGNSDTLTITSQGTALPTGVSIDDPNDQIDCADTTSAGTTNGVILGADDGTAARVDSEAFSVVVAASESEQATKTVCASGCDYTSFNAAHAAAVAGDIIEGRGASPGATFTDNVAVNATANGTAVNRIVTRCRAGDTCVITGSGSLGGESVGVRIAGNYHDFGGVTVQGGALPNGSDIDRGVLITGNNNILRDTLVTQGNFHCVWVTNGANNVIVGLSSYLCGGLDDGDTPPNDYGDVLEYQTAATPGLIYGWKSAATGHNAMQYAQNLWMVKVRIDNLWSEEFDSRHPGVTTDGNRGLSLSQDMLNTTLQGFIIGPIGQPYEATGTQLLRLAYQNAKVRRGLLIGEYTQTGAALNAIVQNGWYGLSANLVYLTVTDARNPCLNMTGGALANGQFTEWRMNIYHSLFYNCNQNPSGGAPQNHTFRIDYDGNSDTKCTVLGSYGNAYETGSTFWFRNRRNNQSASFTLAQMETDCPNDWVGNISVSDPQFVNDDTPRVSRPPQTGYSDSDITTPYANFAPQASSLLNVSDLPGITQLAGSASGVATFDVDSTAAFHAGVTNGGITIPADDICIEGHGAVTIVTIVDGNTLTVDENVTASDNAAVYLGDDCTPNIGWYQGAGNAFGL